MDAFFTGLPQPPLIRQTDAKCWAAALASWLNIVRKGPVPVTMDDLVSVFSEFLVHGGQGALRAEKINDVLTSGAVQMAWTVLEVGDLTHQFLARFLDVQDHASSHIYLVSQYSGRPMSHARVLYRTVPIGNFGGIWMMDPKMGYAKWKHQEAAAFRCLVGVRKEVIGARDGAGWIS